MKPPFPAILFVTILKCLKMLEFFLQIITMILLFCLITARKRSLGQGNVFTPVCHSVHWHALGRGRRLVSQHALGRGRGFGFPACTGKGEGLVSQHALELPSETSALILECSTCFTVVSRFLAVSRRLPTTVHRILPQPGRYWTSVEREPSGTRQP